MTPLVYDDYRMIVPDITHVPPAIPLLQVRVCSYNQGREKKFDWLTVPRVVVSKDEYDKALEESRYKFHYNE